VVGMLAGWLLLDLPWWFGLAMGLTCVVFGTAGDLIESLIKRDVGIKDMSSSLPGHGGVMDRLDSMLVAAPAGWLLFTIFPA
ncbi:MAG: phosphatidate cytidylyltransferase, partial [Propionibacteriaceae bacterium]|nr:phosphatidate cytidylyltransferase [Propionibacteriaceae bacterium]